MHAHEAHDSAGRPSDERAVASCEPVPGTRPARLDLASLRRRAGNAAIAQAVGRAQSADGAVLQRARHAPAAGPATFATATLQRDSTAVLRNGRVVDLLDDLGDTLRIKDSSGKTETVGKGSVRLKSGQKLVLLGQLTRVVDVRAEKGRIAVVALQDQHGELVRLTMKSLFELQRVSASTIRDKLPRYASGQLSRLPLSSAIVLVTKLGLVGPKRAGLRPKQRGRRKPSPVKTVTFPSVSSPTLTETHEEDMGVTADLGSGGQPPVETAPVLDIDEIAMHEDAPVDVEGVTASSIAIEEPPTPSEADRRKARAREAFESWIGEGKTAPEIAEQLPKLVPGFGLEAVSLTATDSELIIAYIASPPIYTHLAKSQVGPKRVEHPKMGSSHPKPELAAVQYDAKLATPLGAIMKQLDLDIDDVNLLAKGDLRKADRPRSVRAVVVGARRRKGGRITGETTPAAIAHLGHHEIMILDSDDAKKIGYYDGGHLIGDQLMPSKGFDTFTENNLAPMEQVLNQQSYLHWCENVIRAGGFDADEDGDLKIPISVVAEVTYPTDDYTIKESQLAKHGIVPAPTKKTGDRTVRIPSRIPYRWQLRAKLLETGWSFQEKSQNKDKIAKLGNTAYPYYDYSDLTTKELSWTDRHWWVLKGSKLASDTITAHTASSEMEFTAYQFYPART